MLLLLLESVMALIMMLLSGRARSRLGDPGGLIAQGHLIIFRSVSPLLLLYRRGGRNGRKASIDLPENLPTVRQCRRSLRGSVRRRQRRRGIGRSLLVGEGWLRVQRSRVIDVLVLIGLERSGRGRLLLIVRVDARLKHSCRLLRIISVQAHARGWARGGGMLVG